MLDAAGSQITKVFSAVNLMMRRLLSAHGVGLPHRLSETPLKGVVRICKIALCVNFIKLSPQWFSNYGTCTTGDRMPLMMYVTFILNNALIYHQKLNSDLKLKTKEVLCCLFK